MTLPIICGERQIGMLGCRNLQVNAGGEYRGHRPLCTQAVFPTCVLTSVYTGPSDIICAKGSRHAVRATQACGENGSGREWRGGAVISSNRLCHFVKVKLLFFPREAGSRKWEREWLGQGAYTINSQKNIRVSCVRGKPAWEGTVGSMK